MLFYFTYANAPMHIDILKELCKISMLKSVIFSSEIIT